MFRENAIRYTGKNKKAGKKKKEKKRKKKGGRAVVAHCSLHALPPNQIKACTKSGVRAFLWSPDKPGRNCKKVRAWTKSSEFVTLSVKTAPQLVGNVLRSMFPWPTASCAYSRPEVALMIASRSMPVLWSFRGAIWQCMSESGVAGHTMTVPRVWAGTRMNAPVKFGRRSQSEKRETRVWANNQLYMQKI